MTAIRHSPKGAAKREEILETALEIVARLGYNGATIRNLADAVGLSKTGLLHHFGTKEELFVEILRRRDAEDLVAFEAALAQGHSIVEAFAGVLTRNANVPGLVQLYSRLAMEASDPNHAAHDYFVDRYREVRREIEGQVRAAVAEGRMTDSVAPEQLALIFVALSDGLQMQWMFDSGVEMGTQIEELFRALRLDALLE